MAVLDALSTAFAKANADYAAAERAAWDEFNRQAGAIERARQDSVSRGDALGETDYFDVERARAETKRLSDTSTAYRQFHAARNAAMRADGRQVMPEFARAAGE